jgi:transcriptional regulator with XRE-family HTH domain
MESMGDRINRLRKAKEWSYRRLAKEMGDAIGTTFSGEAVRRYEIGKNSPGKDARRALAKVFGKTETYIEFGSTGDAPANDPMFSQLVSFYGALSDDAKHALLGHANRLYSQENPGASVANPYPNAVPKRPLLQGSFVGIARQQKDYSIKKLKK